MAAMQKTGGVMDTNVETITSFIMRELKDRELAVFMNAMQASFDYLFYFIKRFSYFYTPKKNHSFRSSLLFEPFGMLVFMTCMVLQTARILLVMMLRRCVNIRSVLVFFVH
jgi:hypothetical protein